MENKKKMAEEENDEKDDDDEGEEEEVQWKHLLVPYFHTATIFVVDVCRAYYYLKQNTNKKNHI